MSLKNQKLHRIEHIFWKGAGGGGRWGGGDLVKKFLLSLKAFKGK